MRREATDACDHLATHGQIRPENSSIAELGGRRTVVDERERRGEASVSVRV
jgi:hypothetical protein